MKESAAHKADAAQTRLALATKNRKYSLLAANGKIIPILGDHQEQLRNLEDAYYQRTGDDPPEPEDSDEEMDHSIFASSTSVKLYISKSHVPILTLLQIRSLGSASPPPTLRRAGQTCPISFMARTSSSSSTPPARTRDSAPPSASQSSRQSVQPSHAQHSTPSPSQSGLPPNPQTPVPTSSSSELRVDNSADSANDTEVEVEPPQLSSKYEDGYRLLDYDGATKRLLKEATFSFEAYCLTKTFYPSKDDAEDWALSVWEDAWTSSQLPPQELTDRMRTLVSTIFFAWFD